MGNVNATAMILVEDANHLGLAVRSVLSSHYVKRIILFKNSDLIDIDADLKSLDACKPIEVVELPAILKYASTGLKTAYLLSIKHVVDSDAIVKLDDDVLWCSPGCIDNLIEYVIQNEDIAVASPYVVNNCFCNGLSNGKTPQSFTAGDFHSWQQSGRPGIKHILDFLDGKVNLPDKDILYRDIELRFGKRGQSYSPELPLFCCRQSDVSRWVNDQQLRSGDFSYEHLLSKLIFKEDVDGKLHNAIVANCIAVKFAYDYQKTYAKAFDRDIAKLMESSKLMEEVNGQ